MIRDLFPSHARTLAQAMRGLTGAEQEEAAHLLRTLGLTAAGGGLPPSSSILRRKSNGTRPAGRPKTPAT